ncbi:MAG: hypothetical protein JO314_05915 [Acidobacteria bacterium]|nr:hypothetical protein [Acidobacteriota bacterium]
MTPEEISASQAKLFELIRKRAERAAPSLERMRKNPLTLEQKRQQVLAMKRQQENVEKERSRREDK